MGQIVDNSPEMDLNDPKFAEMLTSVNPTPEPEEGVKVEKATPSPVVAQDAGELEPTDDPSVLKSQIRGLKAELTRRSGNADKVEELEGQLQNLQGQLQAMQAQPQTQTKTDDLSEAIAKLDDEGVISKLTDWQDELAAARAKYERYEEVGDEAQRAQAAQRITNAKRVISALNKETVVRTERKSQQTEQLRTEAEVINTEINNMYEVVNETFPDFLDQSSDLWKAGNEEYLNHPTLMKKMGPTGEIVAAALAVIKLQNGKQSKGVAATRRDVISRIDKGFNKALSAGAASPSTGRTVDYGASLGNQENLAQFEAMVSKIKGG